MYDDILTEIGLTKSEISVYFALLNLGDSTSGPIIKQANIASGKAYLVLDKLLKKGLITYVVKSGKKYYHAKDPSKLVDYLDEKENDIKNKKEELKKIIPKLQEIYSEKKDAQKAEVYEGINGIKTFYEMILKELKKGDLICVLGVPKESNVLLEKYFLNWNKRRVELGIKMQIIYNNNCREYGLVREQMKLTEVRYMKQELETPAWIDIFNDFVCTINVHGNSTACFLMKNKETANSYRKYFEIMWNQAEK
jgi:sugar-specific transcriptional regulator TrmB